MFTNYNSSASFEVDDIESLQSTLIENGIPVIVNSTNISGDQHLCIYFKDVCGSHD